MIWVYQDSVVGVITEHCAHCSSGAWRIHRAKDRRQPAACSFSADTDTPSFWQEHSIRLSTFKRFYGIRHKANALKDRSTWYDQYPAELGGRTSRRPVKPLAREIFRDKNGAIPLERHLASGIWHLASAWRHLNCASRSVQLPWPPGEQPCGMGHREGEKIEIRMTSWPPTGAPTCRFL